MAANTCKILNLFGKRLTICPEEIQYKNSIAYTSAHIDDYNFTNISKKLIGSKYLFGEKNLLSKDFESGINCIDIDWNGLMLGDNKINHTVDLLNYIQTINKENTELKQYISQLSSDDITAWNTEKILTLDDKYYVKSDTYISEYGSNVKSMADYICRKWNVLEEQAIRTFEDKTTLKVNKVRYPVAITDKYTPNIVDTHEFQTLSTYAHPIEIYWVKDTTTNTVSTMSKRQFQHLTFYPSEYTSGILNINDKYGYLMYSDTNKDGTYSDATIAANKQKYIKLDNYLDIRKATLKGYGCAGKVNNVTKLHQICMPNITENKKFNVIYNAIYKPTNTPIKITRNEYNNLYPTEKSNYTLTFEYLLDSDETQSISQYMYDTLSAAEKNKYSCPCVYVYKDDLQASWFKQMDENTYNNLSDTEKQYYIKYPIFDEEYPNNQYAYYTNDCIYNPLLFLQDTNRLNVLEDICITLSLGYAWFGIEDYYNKFVEQLEVFFINEDTKMYPWLKYSQYHPGYFGSYKDYLYYNNITGKASFDYTKHELYGQPGGLIDTQRLLNIVESIKFMNNIKPIKFEIYSKVQKWFKELSKFMYEHYLGEVEATRINNHVTNYWLNVYAFSAFGNVYSAERELIISKFCECVNNQIDDDGIMTQEVKRYNALSYSVMNMRIILNMCRLIGKKQCLLRIPKVKKAITFLNQFVGKTFDEYKAMGYTESGNYDDYINEVKILVNMFNSIWTYDSDLPNYDLDEHFYKSHRDFVVR